MPPKLDSELKTLSRHDAYYIAGADLCILVEHIHFRVHRYFFERESNWFKSRLLLPSSPGAKAQGSDDSNAIILSDLTPAEFAKFLWVFYNPKYSLYDAEAEDWSTILSLSHRWSFPEVKALAVRELETKLLLDVKRIKLYHENDVDRNILIPRYAALIEREEPLTLAEGMDLGMETTLQIAKGREEARASRLPSGVRSPLTPTVRGADLHGVVRELFKIAPSATVEGEVQEVHQPVNGFHTPGALKKTKAPAPAPPPQLPSPSTERQATPPPVPPKMVTVKIQEQKTTQPTTPTTPKTPITNTNTKKANKGKTPKGQQQPQTPQTPKTAQPPQPTTPKVLTATPAAAEEKATATTSETGRIDQKPPLPPPAVTKEEEEQGRTTTKTTEEISKAEVPSQPQPGLEAITLAVDQQGGKKEALSTGENGAGMVGGTGESEVKKTETEVPEAVEAEGQQQTAVDSTVDAPNAGMTTTATVIGQTVESEPLLPLPDSNNPFSLITFDQQASGFDQSPLSPSSVGQPKSIFGVDWLKF